MKKKKQPTEIEIIREAYRANPETLVGRLVAERAAKLAVKEKALKADWAAHEKARAAALKAFESDPRVVAIAKLLKRPAKVSPGSCGKHMQVNIGQPYSVPSAQVSLAYTPEWRRLIKAGNDVRNRMEEHRIACEGLRRKVIMELRALIAEEKIQSRTGSNLDAVVKLATKRLAK